jgi:hypothetical protein
MSVPLGVPAGEAGLGHSDAVDLVRLLNRLDERVLGPPRPRVQQPLRPGPLRLAGAGAALAVLAGLGLSWPAGWSLGRLYVVVGGGLVIAVVLGVLRRAPRTSRLQHLGSAVGLVAFGPVIELVTRPGWSAGPLVALAGGVVSFAAMVLAARAPRRQPTGGPG